MTTKVPLTLNTIFWEILELGLDLLPEMNL